MKIAKKHSKIDKKYSKKAETCSKIDKNVRNLMKSVLKLATSSQIWNFYSETIIYFLAIWITNYFPGNNFEVKKTKIWYQK